MTVSQMAPSTVGAKHPISAQKRSTRILIIPDLTGRIHCLVSGFRVNGDSGAHGLMIRSPREPDRTRWYKQSQKACYTHTAGTITSLARLGITCTIRDYAPHALSPQAQNPLATRSFFGRALFRPSAMRPFSDFPGVVPSHSPGGSPIRRVIPSAWGCHARLPAAVASPMARLQGRVQFRTVGLPWAINIPPFLQKGNANSTDTGSAATARDNARSYFSLCLLS